MNLVQQKQSSVPMHPVIIHNAQHMEACFDHGRLRNIDYVLFTEPGSLAYTGVDYFLKPFHALQQKYSNPITLILDCGDFFGYASQALKLGAKDIIYIPTNNEQERVIKTLAQTYGSHVWGPEKRPKDAYDLMLSDAPDRDLERLFTAMKTGE